ncbi:MAG: UDP-N-acetylmuramate dehydrogenase [Phycisphaerales bacterium]|nr:MAG: UDP-N-acetylmuramate dehydrogenase [Phycisphaerales bacterium]
MSLSSGLASKAVEPLPLSELTWYRLGGPPRALFRPRTVRELGEVLAACRAEGMPARVLGRGANVLVPDGGYDGAVIQLSGRGFARVRFDGVRVCAGGAADLPRLIRRAVRRGLAGLEGLGGIPGTVGGAVRMNAGGRFGSIGDVVGRVRVYEEGEGTYWIERDAVGFGYRHTDLAGRIVIGAEFELARDDPRRIRERLLSAWAYKKESQPLAAHSAGCVFRNPPGESAGRLIDGAGLKGLRCGLARVSEQHANFIVADEGAKASDVIELIREVRERVFDQYEVRLELEIDVW